MLTIGIPVKDAADYLKITIDSIRRNTKSSYELIIVDDCSNKETQDILKLIPDVKIVHNPILRGFPYNCNIILREARYDTICLLNSDVYCPQDWDVDLVNVCNEFNCIVGPSSNRAPGEQRMLEAYEMTDVWSFSDIEKYAQGLKEEHLFEKEEVDMVGGFCYFLNKKVRNVVGYFDEQYGLGSYEEVDYCLRAKQNKVKTYWLKGAYVHHYGKKSFGVNKNTYNLWKRNQQIFNKKFNINPDIFYRDKV